MSLYGGAITLARLVACLLAVDSDLPDGVTRTLRWGPEERASGRPGAYAVDAGQKSRRDARCCSHSRIATMGSPLERLHSSRSAAVQLAREVLVSPLEGGSGTGHYGSS